jgi:hypothetical protein
MMLEGDFRDLGAPFISAPMSRKLLERFRIATSASVSAAAAAAAAAGGDGVVCDAGGLGVAVGPARGAAAGRSEDLRVESDF